MLAVAASSSQPATPAAQRAIVVIGDLHFGVGRDGSRWHPSEDFRWRDEFIAFLQALDTEGSGATDLVINGDLFELSQSPAALCKHDEASIGCTEREALQQLQTVVAAHADELQAIGTFARSGENRVHLVPGDHDAALLFASVGARALKAFGAPDNRVQLARSGGWLSPDGRIYVEHGHQLPLSPHRFTDWPRPFSTVWGKNNHLERPWGEQVIQPFVHRTESRYPIVDNVAEYGVGAKYVAAAEGVDPAEGVPPLLRYFLTKTAWQQFRMDLDDGDVKAPAWDLESIRGDPSAFLASSLPRDDPFASFVSKAASDARLRALERELTDAQIIAICDYRAAIRRARRRMERVLTQLPGLGPPLTECPRTPDTVGSEFEHYWRSRDLAFTRHIAATLNALQREKRTARPFDVFVYGHTHLTDRPFRPHGTDDGPIVASSGVWQRTIYPVQLELLATERGVAVRDLVSTLQPEDLPECYTFLRIPGSIGPLTLETRAWRRDKQAGWGFAANCGQRP